MATCYKTLFARNLELKFVRIGLKAIWDKHFGL